MTQCMAAYRCGIRIDNLPDKRALTALAGIALLALAIGVADGAPLPFAVGLADGAFIAAAARRINWVEESIAARELAGVFGRAEMARQAGCIATYLQTIGAVAPVRVR